MSSGMARSKSKSAKPAKPAKPEDIILEPFDEALSQRYLAYALSTITNRALPDLRDGLKPVHRRLLHAMNQLNLNPSGSPKKSARVVGDVIGRYHPHGDQSVYDALVRLAQDFSVRYPLVDGQGNFGNIDGDSAAAMRYTEARLTDVAKALLEGIDEDAIDFRETYDGEGKEPVVLPAAFPNLLADGSTGIAVGMATSIPPHNVGEVCAALKELIKRPDATIDKLVDFIQGPDFPTGGILVEDRAAIVEAYATGKGHFRTRARWFREELKQGQYQIVVTEIPYLVQKSRLVERIAELLSARKLPLLDDVRDESAEDVRLVLVPKSRNVDPEHLMRSLYKATDLENRFSLNMNVLDGGTVPRVMNLREVLQAFLDHRHEVLVRRSRYRLNQIEKRLEILDGYLIVYLNLDEVIRIIRYEDDPKAELIARYELTELQADSILNMRLKALRKLEELEIRKEHETLSTERDDLVDLLGDEARRWKIISKQIDEINKRFGDKTEIGQRRTEIGDKPTEIDVPLEAFVEREPITVLVSEKGWVRALKGHQADVSDAKYKEGDAERFWLHTETTDKLLVFSTTGRCYTLGCDRLPSGRGFGEPLRLMVDMEEDADIAVVLKLDTDANARLIIASSEGRGFLIKQADCVAQTRTGKQVLNVSDKVKLVAARPIDGTADYLAVIGENRKLLVFPLDQIPEMTRGKGVILQRYKDGGLSDAKGFKLEDGLSWRLGEKTRTEADLTAWMGNRAGSGRLPPHGFPSNNRFG